jgi:nitronate monooxygenase
MSLPQVLSGLRVPVIGAPMFLVSHPELVIAQCKAGIVGAFPALNARPQHVLEEWLKHITEELSAYKRDHPNAIVGPIAVNQIVHKSNDDRLMADIELCAKYKVPIIITSLGAREDVNNAVHAYGGIVLHDVINTTFAKKAIDKGADGLIAVCAGAGGHAGVYSPFALVQEIRAFFDGPLAVSGAIANGAAVLAAQAMGADLAYIGSAFIATQEATAPEDYKSMVVQGGADSIVYTNKFSGVNANYLAPSIVRWGIDPRTLWPGSPSGADLGVRGGDQSAGPKVWKDIWGCGQGIGAVRNVVATSELVERLAHEYAAAKQRISAS